MSEAQIAVVINKSHIHSVIKYLVSIYYLLSREHMTDSSYSHEISDIISHICYKDNMKRSS